MNLLFSNIDEFAKGLYVLIISVNLDSFSLTNHKVFIKFNKFPPPNFHTSYIATGSRLICLHHYTLAT